ncbi:MAG: Kazal-type serine protease inhibitor domain-containing protein [Flavobacteriales bacterium]
MKKPRIITLLAAFVVMGLLSCDKIEWPEKRKIDDCHDLSLIGKNPNIALWMYYDPVCGCDGKTYGNKDIAMYDYGVISFTKGPCEKDRHPIDECHDTSLIGKYPVIPFCGTGPIKDVYHAGPVCGCDGVTYGSAYEAMHTYGVKNYTEGPCGNKNDNCIDSSKINYAMDCIALYDPVCGCNGVTYSNVCEANYAGVISYTKGECGKKKDECIDESKINPSAFCTMDYAPVCGCNVVTYSNACQAEANGVVSYTPGSCNKGVPSDDCYDPSQIHPIQHIVAPVYDPVCGCDGKTYYNAEEAMYTYGVKKFEKGPCNGIIIDSLPKFIPH